MRVVLNITGVALAAILLAFALSQAFGVRFFSVLSGSMEPDIPTGSVVVTVPESLAGEIQTGDVVSYVADENLTVVTHRVVDESTSPELLTTQGDANKVADPPVLRVNVVGKVAFVVPALGYPLSYLATTPGKIIAITAIVTFFLLATLINLLFQKKPKPRLVITYDNEDDLTPDTFSRIAEGLQARRGE